MRVFATEFPNFSGALSRTFMLGGATAPLPRPYPLDVRALRASRASFGAFGSVVRLCPGMEKSKVGMATLNSEAEQ